MMAGLNSQRLQQKMIGANEDMFLQAFESTPKLNFATQKKLENELTRVIQIISNPNADWENRMQAMKHFRSVINSGILVTDEFYSTTLKTLEIPFQNNICDLRSQVVRETCITIAFLSCRLQQKFARMAEILLPSLIKLIPNSAKIVSTSALVALRFIIQSTHNSKLITIIKYQLFTSKSKEIHKALCEIAERIVTLWSPSVIDRQINDFVEVLRLGICDSDELARQYARRAFNVFAEHFREHADRLFNSLDHQRQRMLNNLHHGGGSTLSINGYGSTTSGLNTLGTSSANNNHHISSATTSSTTHHHQIAPSNYGPSSISSMHSSATSSNIVSRLKSSLTTSNGSSAVTTSKLTAIANKTSTPSRIRTPTARSTSAIDVDAQQRARARAVYLTSMYQRPRNMNNLHAPSPVKSNLPQPIHHTPSTSIYHSPQATSSSSSSSNSTLASHAAATSVTPSSVNLADYNNSSNVPSADAISPHTNRNTSNNNYQYQQQTSGDQCAHSSSVFATPQQIKPPSKIQQQPPATPSAEKLSKAASYINSIISNNSIAESGIVTTIKYFNTLIEKHPQELVDQLLPELMPPLVVGMDHAAISVRKASVFAMIAIYAKVGIEEMETYLTSLTMTQRKLIDVYIKKHNEEALAS